MKKLVVFLFPSKNFCLFQEQYVQKQLRDKTFKISNIFDKIIKERYIEKGFDFVIAQYRNEEIYGITIQPSKIVYSHTTYEKFSNRDEQSIKEDYNYLASSLNPKLYDMIIVGGYHSTECVLKLTSSINKLSNNAYIDCDLTNDFIHSVFIIDNLSIKGVNHNFNFSKADTEEFINFNHCVLALDPYNQTLVKDSLRKTEGQR